MRKEKSMEGAELDRSATFSWWNYLTPHYRVALVRPVQNGAAMGTWCYSSLSVCFLADVLEMKVSSTLSNMTHWTSQTLYSIISIQVKDSAVIHLGQTACLVCAWRLHQQTAAAWRVCVVSTPPVCLLLRRLCQSSFQTDLAFAIGHQ